MSNPKPTIYPAPAKAAFEKLRPRIEALPASAIQNTNTSVDAAAIFAYGVADELNQSAMHKRFETLPATEFNIQNLHDLGPAALAAWHAATELLSANAQSTEAKLPVELASEAIDKRTQMLKVCDYHFEPDSPVGREVADIRIGTGYRDLAQDMSRLSKLYRANHAMLKADGVHYRAADAKKADELSARILKELSASRTNSQNEWTELTARAWTLLNTLYIDVTATAAWMRRAEGGATLYPSLVAAGRTARRSRAAGEGEGGAGGEGQAGGDAASDPKKPTEG